MAKSVKKNTEKTYPLVLVFYLDREMMKNKEILQPFANSVNNIINVKNFNVMSFFLPTDGEERIECINPIVTSKEEMDKVQKLIDDIQKAFAINEKFEDIPDEDIIVGEE